MNDTPTSKATEPQGALARADEQLAHVHEQISRADEELTRLSEQLARMERGEAQPPSAGPVPQSPPKKRPHRALIGLPLAAGIIVAALVLQSSYGDGVVARWAPQLVSTPSLPPENPPLPAQSAPSPMEVAAAEAAPPPATVMAQTTPQQATPQQTTPQQVAPAAVAALPDPTPLLEKMARDLANMERSIEQLRANQQQISSDNSKAVQELKASQEEIKRALAKVSEQAPPRASSPPAQPTPALRKPERVFQPPPVRARPRIPRQWYYDDDW